MFCRYLVVISQSVHVHVYFSLNSTTCISVVFKLGWSRISDPAFRTRPDFCCWPNLSLASWIVNPMLDWNFLVLFGDVLSGNYGDFVSARHYCTQWSECPLIVIRSCTALTLHNNVVSRTFIMTADAQTQPCNTVYVNCQCPWCRLCLCAAFVVIL